MESPADRNLERLQRVCDLLTQVADDLQGELQLTLCDGIPAARAGAVIRLACQIESLNQLAAQTWEIRSARVVAATVGARLEAISHG